MRGRIVKTKKLLRATTAIKPQMERYNTHPHATHAITQDVHVCGGR